MATASLVPTAGLMPAIWDPFDPLESIGEAMLDAYSYMMEWLSKFLADPPNFTDSGMLPVLYKSSANAAEVLAYYGLVLGIILGIGFFKGKTLFKSIAVFLIVGALAPIWVRIVNSMWEFGNILTGVAHVYEASPDRSGSSIDNPVMGAALFSFNAYLAGCLAAIVISFGLLVIGFKFWLPLAYGLSGSSKRFKTLVEILLAIGLVATIFGRAFAQFWLDMGQLMVDTFPFGDTMVGGGLYTLVSLDAAIIWQVILVFVFYKAVDKVEGKVSALVAGTTVSVIKRAVKVDVRNTRNGGRNGLEPVRYGAPVPTRTTSPVKQAGKDLSRKAAHTASNAAAAYAGGTVGPAGGAAVKVTGDHFFGPKQAPPAS